LELFKEKNSVKRLNKEAASNLADSIFYERGSKMEANKQKEVTASAITS
jgi:hypothetical protein